MRTSTAYETGFDEQSGNHPPTNTCPECEGTLRTDGGETRCADCGLILEEYRIDRRGRPIYDNDDYRNQRTGAPLTETRHDRGLSTIIGRGADGHGTSLSDKKRRQLSRLRREHNRAKLESKADRNLASGCTEIARITSALGLARSLREQASSLFRTAQAENLLQGRTIEGFAGGSVYAACRCNSLPRSIDEIETVSRVDARPITVAYRVLNRELNLPVPPRRPREFIPPQASKLDVPPETERLAIRIAERAHETGLSIGPNPMGFAAACLEVAVTRDEIAVTQLELADTANVTPATVREHRDAIRRRLPEWSL